MSEKFWDKIADGYAKKPVADQVTYDKKLKITQGYLNKDMRVLEFGCGTGSTAIAHASYVKHILAIDLSSNMIEIAQSKKNSGNIRNIDFEQSSIEKLSVSEDCFDAVMAHSVLHLVDNPSSVLETVHHKLKSGGVFVSSTVCMGDSFVLSIMARLISFASIFGVLPRLKILSCKGLLSMVDDAGFDIEYQWKPRANDSVFIVARKR